MEDNKIEVGDIVEIITHRYKSWNDYPIHERGYYENQRTPAPFIGQRFKVFSIDEERNIAFNQGYSLSINLNDLLLIHKSISTNKKKNFFKNYLV